MTVWVRRRRRLWRRMWWVGAVAVAGCAAMAARRPLGGAGVQRGGQPRASSQHRRLRLDDRSVYGCGGEWLLGDREPAAGSLATHVRVVP